MKKNRNKKENQIKAPAPGIFDLLLPDRIEENPDYIRLNDYYVRMMVVEAIPEVIHFGWFSRLTGEGGVTLSVILNPYTHQQASSRIAYWQKVLGSELILAHKQGNTQRIGVLETKYAFYNQLLTDINLHRNNIMSAVIVIAVYAKSLEELNEKSGRIRDILGATRAVTLYKRQLEGFKAVLPFARTDLPEYHDVTVANAACLSPLISLDFTHPSGIYFGITETGSPVLLDLFIGQPYLYGPHMFICGTTRAGKSYTCKGITARSVASGIQTIILDPEGEYKKLAEALGGVYIKFHPAMKPAFNPFDIEPEVDDTLGEFLNIPEKIDDIVSLVATMMEVQSGEKLTAEERALAGMAVREEYHSRGITEDPASLYMPGGIKLKDGIAVGRVKKEMPTISSYIERLKKLNAHRLANVLMPFKQGGPQGFFDGQSAYKISEEPLVVFDIKDLGSDFSKTYAMYVLLAWAWEKFVKKSRRRKRILVDEAWLFMGRKDTSQFLSQMARRGAKYNTSLLLASQSIREFLTEEGMSLLGQCDTKFFLKLQQNEAEALGEVFKLPPNVVERLKTFQAGQGILKAGNQSAVVYFRGLPFEEHFLRSDPEAMLVR
ncbi:VirB4 family type IV secretion system protein [Carboxydothermus ferrireducens]|uniref:TraG P-loop domain-containing protein n=1 Tax=Carboxydothermus ferrireducens DSM 11255 TaxID=1119529 RepID=A0ABX2R7V2_9THEO|nr:ATP-binding protein [Carboxydothermus ferrireducens]NYE57135.1 hypothetical protein [Carboxydothermus ferrireducens DSM 11255]